MEFPFYPLALHAEERGINLNVNDLIIKGDLLRYYHSIPARFGQTDRIRTGEKVVRIEPHERGFLGYKQRCRDRGHPSIYR